MLTEVAPTFVPDTGDDRSLRVALLTYRGQPYSGGQGVYVRNLSRELTELGHHVTVLSGPPYPDLDEGVALVRLPSLELYVAPGPFGSRAWARIRTWPDVVEFWQMFFGQFSEPRSFSLRARRALQARAGQFDVVHDNQCLGVGLLGVMDDGFPVLATVHHPLTVDLAVSLDHLDDPVWARSIRRFYGFLDMQRSVASRLPRVITVSQRSAGDTAVGYGVDPGRIRVVAVGTDPARFSPRPEVERVPGRIVTTASADVPIKGLAHLVAALAEVRTRRPDAHLVVVAKEVELGPVPDAIARHGVADAIEFVSGISDDELVALYATAEVAVVPSLYEGFSLPAVEAMSCAVPLVAAAGGALPEVVGTDGTAGVLVPPADPDALAGAIVTLLESPALREQMGAAGRRRVLERFTWRRCAEATVAQYREVMAESRRPQARSDTFVPADIGI